MYTAYRENFASILFLVFCLVFTENSGFIGLINKTGRRSNSPRCELVSNFCRVGIKLDKSKALYTTVTSKNHWSKKIFRRTYDASDILALSRKVKKTLNKKF